MSKELPVLVQEIAHKLVKNQQTVTTVESCTAGGIAHALTAIAGSSQWFNQGLITYSNQAKAKLAGVSLSDIAKYGAVSAEVAQAMALGGQSSSNADYALSITGIAGPGGGSEHKPVGTVWFGCATPNQKCFTEKQVFDGNRDEVRTRAVLFALEKLLKFLNH